MKTVMPSGIVIEWHANTILEEARVIVEGLEKDAAKKIASEAKRRCPVWDGEERKIGPNDKTWKARKRGALRDSIRVEPSKYKDGGYIVLAGNYDVFYASFVELGTKSWWGKGYTRKGQVVGKYKRRPLSEDPFLRIPLKQESRKFWRRVENVFRGGVTK